MINHRDHRGERIVNDARALIRLFFIVSRSDKVQGPEKGVRGSCSRLREGQFEEHERWGSGEEDSGAQGNAESRIPRDLDTALPSEQQSLQQQAHVPGHRGLAQRSSCKVSMLEK